MEEILFWVVLVAFLWIQGLWAPDQTIALQPPGVLD